MIAYSMEEKRNEALELLSKAEKESTPEDNTRVGDSSKNAQIDQKATEGEDVGVAVEAVNLLCEASRQGDEQATDKLRELYEQQYRGIVESNLADVRYCVNTSQLEKTARLAAGNLFRALNPLSPNQDLLQELTKQETKLLRKAMTSKGHPIEDEERFIESVLKRLHGSGGVSLDTLLQSSVDMEAFNDAPLLTKLRRYPGKTLSVLVDRTIDAAGTLGLDWFKRLIPTNQIYMVLAFFFYSLITLDLVLWFVPLAVFSLGLAAMLVSTMQMFYTRRKRRDVSTMARLLSRFNDALEHDSATSAYDWHKMAPYMTYFLALFFTIAAFALSDQAWIPCSELFWLSVMFCGTCFYALSDDYDHLLVLSIVLDIVASLPTFIHALPHIPVIKPLLVLAAGNLYSVQILPTLYVNIGIPSMAGLVVPVLFARMARQKSWQGWYQILIPHLVCFTWWKTSMLFFQHASWLGLVRASVGWVTFTLLFPLAVLAGICWLIYTGLYVFTVSNLLKVVVTVLLMALPIGIGFWAKGGIKLETFSLRGNTWVRKGVLLVAFAVAFSAMFLHTPIEPNIEGNFVTWDQYKRFCSAPQWYKTNMADSQIKCSHLKNSIVEWQGLVKKIVIKETHNHAEDFLSYFPLSVSDFIKCAYGEKYPDCDTISEDENERDLCKLATMQGHQSCHLKKLDIYTFDVWVQMPLHDSGGDVHDVIVEATNWFRKPLLRISTGDVIKFRAALKSDLGNSSPRLKLFHVSCEAKSLSYGSKSTLSETSWRVLQRVRQGACTAWNLFLAPVLQLTTG